jgi:hypothetical protein
MMNLTSRTEMLIQRCIDDELSAADTQRLLQELNEITDGWKCLACGLLEDRQLRKVLPTEISSSLPVVEDSSVPAKVALRSPLAARHVAAPARRWWSHPLTSVSLCLAIAFLVGLLLSEQQSPVILQSETQPAISSPPPALPVGQAGNLTLEWPQGRQFNVPIYPEYEQLLKAEPNHPFRKMLEAGGPSRLLMVPDGNGRTILVPMPEERPRQLQ